MSAESGLKTFRDAGGLWEGYDVSKVATPEAWHSNMELVLEFYNQRRAQLKSVMPNQAHYALAELERSYQVNVVTQNVDNLHERAGSSNVLHLHGELTKVRSTGDDALIYEWTEDLNIGDVCEKGYQLRPHIVWFGEMVPEMENAAYLVYQADIIIIIGTSMQVYPAASLIGYAKSAKIYYIDPNPNINYELNNQSYTLISKKAAEGMQQLLTELL